MPSKFCVTLFVFTAINYVFAVKITGGDDKYNLTGYTPGKWNYDYSQIRGSEISGCPNPCGTSPSTKCGPHCWLTISDTAGKNQCDPIKYPLQTPIDISNFQSENSPELTTAFENVLGSSGLNVTGKGCDKFKILADDHAWEINFKEASCTAMKMTWKGIQMTLEQFHTHTPSEHTINGMYADGELHMVHKAFDANGKLTQAAVLGVMLVVDPDLKTSPLTTFWDLVDEGADAITNWNKKDYKHDTRYSAEWEVEEAEVPVDAYSLLPADKTFYHYIGSLTTYPCTNGINWFLFQEPMMITKDDLANLISAVKHQNFTLTLGNIYDPYADNRPLQPQGERRVWKYTDAASQCDPIEYPFGCTWDASVADDDDEPPHPPPGGLIAAAVIAAFFGSSTMILLYLRSQASKVGFQNIQQMTPA